ncbi:helix-turn-helix transcriptional regulator [Mesorhizobium sp.]|uniref:helix-turn-helix domain-containing protein n=1 Tax=Mesorhizobium sp. TaxID=1871066 RepID=UPI000FE82C89|nr:helix-turn-helix transcriptional regulator [Mesorhizobium sp.]RWP56542.1 MAG: XRE family transcriptional regulator [Mesorhizobium sp.]
MAGPSFEEWISHLGLQEINDPQFDKPVYRKTNFGKLELCAEIEKRISTSLRNARDRRKIPRSKLAPMLGLSDQVYNRYENAVSRLTVGRLLHICEVLSISPVEILYPVAPHLWGEELVEAEARKSIIDKLELFDGPTLTAILDFLQHLQTKPNRTGSEDHDAAQAAPSFSVAAGSANGSDLHGGK